MVPNSQPNAQVMAAELKLIQAVELKFALTSTDASLERVASIYLCPLLLKLATPYQSNRKKVEEVLAMLDNRIRGNASVKLPFEPLLAQYKDPTVSEVVKTRTIQYLCSALGDRSCSSALLQQLVNGFAKYPVMQKPIVFYMIGSMLATFPSPESTQEEKAICLAYQISREEDATSLAKCLIDLMFLNPAQLNPQRAANRNAVQSVPTPLLQGEIEFLTPLGSSTYTATSLTAVKLGILRFASISILKDAFRFEIGLVASFDLKHDLQMQANTVMRRCNPATSEQIYVDELFNLLLNRSLEARFAIRVYQLLSKSTLATREADKAQRCITQGVESSSPKVRTAAIGFLNWFARFSPSSPDNLTTKTLLSQLTFYIASPESSDESKGSAYVAIGLLCKRDVGFTRENTEIVQTLFSALVNETPSIRPAIEEALSSLVNCFATAGASCLQELRVILIRVITNGPGHTHYTALRMALATFDFADVSARWLCLLAMQGVPNAEALQEARRGLNMSIFALTRQENISLSFPHFEDMVNWCSFNDAAIAAELRVDDLAPLAKAAYFHFSETCLLVNALTLTQDLHPEKEDFESRLRATFEHEEGARKALQNYVSSRSYSSFDRSFTLFQAQVLEDYKKTGDPDSGNVLLDLLLLSGNLPENLSVDDVAALKPIEVKQSSEQRDLNARLYAIISTANIRSEADILKDCHALSKRSSRTPQEELHALSLLAKILLRSQLRARNIKVDLSSPERALQDNLQVRDINLQKSSIEIVSTFGLLQCYPITARTHNTKSLIHLITRPSTDSTVVERCAIALGNVSLYYEDDSTELTEIIDTLSSDAGTVAKAEVLLAKGEALACCVGRWDSKSLRNSLDVPVDIPLLGTRSKRLLEVMENLLVNTRSAQSHQRRGACLRLISLVQLLPLTEMSAKWGNIHAAFLSLLSDTDEFISESANKGIQIVYKRCDKKTKDDLVAQLFSTMTSDAAARQSTAAISADSEIFQPGTMTVGTGTNESSISTYKDICSLAMDAGNTSLVYSFLSLASSSAMWSTRQGVALGLNSLLADSDTADDLRKSPEVLSRLLPKLFRYKHDPSAKVAKSMNAIFQQLYPDVKAALDDNFESVCSELLKSLSDQSWRVRESAGRAMATLITGRPLSLLTSRLEEIWSLSFRILDDVKESVRLAGIDLCQTLSSLIIRAVSSATSPIEASRTLDFVIPLFIKNLRSLSAEVGAFSLKTLLKITKEAGSPIKAHLPQLIDEYLQLTSTMEPEMMNYLSFHAAKYNITQNDLDTHRLNSLRASPLLEALEQCIDQLDETSVAQTVPQVCQIIRQSNGLPTKAATARFLISLVVRCSTLVKPHADTIIQALSTTLHDRNQSVVQTYASCIGYMARVASPEKLIKLVNFASAKFFTAQDENNALGLVIKAISQNANDKFISMADIFFPLCFVAMHDPEEVSAALFKGVWQDNTGSPQAIKLYLVEVLPLLESQLASPVWRIKQMAANTIAEIASKVDLGQQTDRVFGALIEALKGKSWNGKEAVLQAMVALTSRNYDRFTIDQLSEIREIMFRESRRTNMAYKSHALDSLATYLTVDRDGDSFSDTLETVEDVLDIDSCMDDTEDFTEPERQTLVQRALTCLIHACRPTSAATDAYAVVLRHCVRQVETQPWTIKVSMTTDLKDLYARIGAEPGHEWRAEDVQATWTFLASLASDRAYQSVREAASETLVVFVKSLRKVPDEPRAVMERQLDELVEGEQSTVVQAILNRVTFES